MKNRRPIETSEDLVRAFADLFDEIAPETPEDIDAELREAGYDPDEVAARMRAAAERAIAESPLNWRTRAQQELAEARARVEDFGSALPSSRENIVQAIKRLLAQLGPRTEQAYAHFRNFESLSDEDLASLLTEIEYLARQQQKLDQKSEE